MARAKINSLTDQQILPLFEEGEIKAGVRSVPFSQVSLERELIGKFTPQIEEIEKGYELKEVSPEVLKAFFEGVRIEVVKSWDDYILYRGLLDYLFIHANEELLKNHGLLPKKIKVRLSVEDPEPDDFVREAVFELLIGSRLAPEKGTISRFIEVAEREGYLPKRFKTRLLSTAKIGPSSHSYNAAELPEKCPRCGSKLSSDEEEEGDGKVFTRISCPKSCFDEIVAPAKLDSKEIFHFIRRLPRPCRKCGECPISYIDKKGERRRVCACSQA